MASNNSLGFGIGLLVATPTGGSPVQFGTLQDVSVEFKANLKELMGQYKFPVAVAAGAAKITWKAKSANIIANSFNLLFNGAQTVGQKLWAWNEAGSIPAVSTYTITVANATHFDADMGVAYAASGIQLLQVASGPTVGQYSVNQSTGVYTFAAADEGKAVYISYTYTNTTTGVNTVVKNTLMGATVPFQLDLYQNNAAVSGQQWSLRLYQAVSSGLTLGFKNEDWAVPEIEGGAFQNSAGGVFEFNTAL